VERTIKKRLSLLATDLLRVFVRAVVNEPGKWRSLRRPFSIYNSSEQQVNLHSLFFHFDAVLNFWVAFWDDV